MKSTYRYFCASIGVGIPLNATVELLDVILKLFTPDMVRVTWQLYIPLSSVALVSVALIVNDDVVKLLVTYTIEYNYEQH